MGQLCPGPQRLVDCDRVPPGETSRSSPTDARELDGAVGSKVGGGDGRQVNTCFPDPYRSLDLGADEQLHLRLGDSALVDQQYLAAQAFEGSTDSRQRAVARKPPEQDHGPTPAGGQSAAVCWKKARMASATRP